MVIDNISWTTSVKPWRSSAVYSSSSGRRCPPNPAVASALTGTPTMLPPVPSGSKVITVNETRAPSSSSTASSAFGVAGNVVTGRVSTPTASPSSEFDSVRTPTTNTAAAPTINDDDADEPEQCGSASPLGDCRHGRSWYNERSAITSSTAWVTR